MILNANKIFKYSKVKKNYILKVFVKKNEDTFCEVVIWNFYKTYNTKPIWMKF